MKVEGVLKMVKVSCDRTIPHKKDSHYIFPKLPYIPRWWLKPDLLDTRCLVVRRQQYSMERVQSRAYIDP